jgi:transcriptional regulator with XRE-family HTH domain
MDANQTPAAWAGAFAEQIRAAREAAGLSAAELARAAGLSRRQLTALERGDDIPSDGELGVLAQACGVAVFDLIPAGYSLRVLVKDPAGGVSEAAGDVALDVLLRDYLAMVGELRSGRPITAPSLRHDDVDELAATLGGTPEAMEARLVALLGDDEDGRRLRSLLFPSNAESYSV